MHTSLFKKIIGSEPGTDGFGPPGKPPHNSVCTANEDEDPYKGKYMMIIGGKIVGFRNI